MVGMVRNTETFGYPRTFTLLNTGCNKHPFGNVSQQTVSVMTGGSGGSGGDGGVHGDGDVHVFVQLA